MASQGRVVSIADLRMWADAIVALGAVDELPERTVLVPSESHAHALRRELVGRAPHALIGTRFFTAPAAARGVLEHAGVDHQTGEEVRRSLRVRAVIRSRPVLRVYDIDLLGSPGWEVAFAATIEQLEAAGLAPGDLDAVGDARTQDLATLWRALDRDAGNSWTLARIMREAAARLASGAARWPFGSSVIAFVDASLDVAHARLLRAIPRVTCGVAIGRPARQRAIARMEALLGDEAAGAMTAETRSGDEREIGILHEYLFESPVLLARADRRRSSGPDGSVTLEQFSSVDEELDAAVRWVADEVFVHGSSVQDLAILVPNADPLTTLVADRLVALPWPNREAPVFLPHGRPATATASGARLAQVLAALAAGLPGEAVVELLPRLRLAGSNDHLRPRDARRLVRRLGTLGGSPARPEAAPVWRERLVVLASDPTLEPIAPALAALSGLAAQLLAGEPVVALWSAIRTFAETHLIAGPELETVLDALHSALVPVLEDSLANELVGVEALAWISAQLEALRLDAGRYGAPAIYVGTIAGAAGLPFRAVRIVGMIESAYPGTLREDPILPAPVQRQLPPHSIASDDDYATARLHAFDRVIRGTAERVVLTVPRTDLDASEREPAAVFVEVAAALGRPHARTGMPGRAVPTLGDLERDAFAVARSAARERSRTMPLTERCWFDRIGATGAELPAGWITSELLDPRAILARTDVLPGVLGAEPLPRPISGISAELPLSATALRELLVCPQRFLLERVLGLWAREELPTSHRLDPASYGQLVHRIVEQFGREHGVAFGARAHDLAHWLTVADVLAIEMFEELAAGYPLSGATVVEAERRRIRRDVDSWITYDWAAGRPRELVAVEREFGKAEPCVLETDAGPLFVSGRIDRVDVEGAVTLVRDLKTGRAQPRERDDKLPRVEIDVQLGLYAEVVRMLAATWGISADVAAAYVYVEPRAVERERAFRGDRDAFLHAARAWIAVAAAIVWEQSFITTTNTQDCRWCPFAPVCGDAPRETASRIAASTGAIAAFRELKA